MNKTLKKVLVVGVIGVAVAVGGYYYMNIPQDVQGTEAFVEIEAAQLVDEYLADANAANEKYLEDNGESKVIVVKGIIKSIDTDQNNQLVATLKSNNDDLGVSCTFTAKSNQQATSLKVGDNLKVKGVVRSGAEYDEDLDLYEDAIIEKCAIVD